MNSTPFKKVAKGVLPRALENMYNAYAFESVDTGPAFAYDTISEWSVGTTAVMKAGLDAITSRLRLDPKLAEQEREFYEKMSVNWRLIGAGTVVPHTAEELSCRNAAQAAALKRYFKRRLDYYLKMINELGPTVINEIMATAAVRLDRAKGSPLWIPGTDPAGGVTLRALVQQCDSLTTLRREVDRLARGRPSFAQTSYIRIQAARGPVDGWAVGPDDCLVPYTINGRPKVRRICAIPFILNHMWVPYAEVLRTVMALTPHGQHKGKIEPLLEEAKKWKHYHALDLKSFDTTVAYETHVALRDYLWLPVVQHLYSMAAAELKSTLIRPSDLAELDEIIITMPILTPPRCPEYAAEIWPAIGQTRSGENPTSWKGTEVRRAHCEAKADYLGLKQGRFVMFNYGDDTLMMTNQPDYGERWDSEPEFLGMKEVPAPDATFLMKRVPYGYGYLGRMVSASINREVTHEPSNVIAAASAFATRHHLLKGHPLQGEYLRQLDQYGGPARFRNAVQLAGDTISADGTGIQATLYLGQLAAEVVERQDGSQREDIAQALGSLASIVGLSMSDKSQIRTMAAAVDLGQHGQTHSLGWMALNEAARSMPSNVLRETFKKYQRIERR